MIHTRDDYDRIQDPANKIPINEPVFLLRAQDKIAWQIVELYAWCAELSGASPELVAVCRAHSKLMKDWPIKKTPDL